MRLEPDHGDYRRLFRSLVWRMVAVSVVPLLVVGAASFGVFFRVNRAVVTEQHASYLRQHRASIDAFLAARTAEITRIARQYAREDLLGGELERALAVIGGDVYVDLGVIDARGDHLRYVGPYDLAGRNYRDAPWFGEVMEKGVHVSDVFLGYRGVPHFIIAVRRDDLDGPWILRATVSTEYFSALVDAARSGRTGETFIVSSEGLYQTHSRSGGDLLTPSGFPDLVPHDGIRVREVELDGRSYLYTAAWLDRPRWLLLYRQELREVYAPLGQASLLGLATIALGALAAAALAVVVARRQVRTVAAADRDKAALAGRLLVTGKTAAVGEMSAGLAHEINNPLATIDALRTWIGDLAGASPISEEDRAEVLESARKIGEQVERCKQITQGLLKFSRRVESSPQELDLNQLLSELVTMARTRARVENVVLEADLHDLPPIVSTPTHLQQIFINVVNNAIDAVAGQRDGQVVIRSRPIGERVKVVVSDNGPGIPEENLSRIFLPFFTTKPVGRGTGLGLAICYGLAQELGGTILVDSKVGAGSSFTVILPLRAPARPTPDAPTGRPVAEASP